MWRTTSQARGSGVGAAGHVLIPSGEYFVKRKVTRANKQAYDANLAQQLWARSVAMTES